MPPVGFGTFGMEGAQCERAIENALRTGHRLFDCGEIYGNETEIGNALASDGVQREDLFIVSKFWFDKNSPAAMREALLRSLERMQLDRFDLYMLHWPTEDMNLSALFSALEEQQAEGLITDIGICNFTHSGLKRLLASEQCPVRAVELEWHPYIDQRATHEMLRDRGIDFIAYCPLAQGRVADEALLIEIGERHGVLPSSIALAWLLGRDGVTVIPKAQDPLHQRANFEATQIRLTDEEMAAIDALPKTLRIADFDFSPDWNA